MVGASGPAHSAFCIPCDCVLWHTVHGAGNPAGWGLPLACCERYLAFIAFALCFPP